MTPCLEHNLPVPKATRKVDVFLNEVAVYSINSCVKFVTKLTKGLVGWIAELIILCHMI